MDRKRKANMKRLRNTRRNGSETALSVLILLVVALAGCATRPPSEDAARVGVLRCPSPGERMAFPAQHFSIIGPPADWHCKEDDTGLTWDNNETGSQISMEPETPLGLGLSRGALTELMTSGMGEIVLRDEFQEGKVTLAEEQDVSFNGRPFYQITMDAEVPSEDIQIKAKIAMYFPKFEFEYSFMLVALRGKYEKDRLIIEQMLGGPTAHAPPTTPIKIGGSLHEAAAKGDLEQIKQLIAQGADVNESDAAVPPLYVALYKGHAAVAELLIAKGADVNAKDEDGHTLLHRAAVGGDKNMAELLIARGSDVDAKTKHGETSLHWAAQQGDIVFVKLLIAKGADVNATNNNGLMSLHWVAGRGDKAVAKLLIAKGADVNAKAKDGDTPLYATAYVGHTDMAELLIAKGANVNVKNEDGRTPLHRAVEYGQIALAELLLAHGADVNAKDKHGLTPMRLAVNMVHLWGEDIIELLKRHGAKE